MKELKRVLFFVTGIFCLLLGLAGLALPFLQGWLLIFLGTAFLALSSRRIRNWIESHTQRFPHLHNGLQRVLNWLERNIGNSD
jgi:uncharacterized membrane protein YbaN (DUF454 family)